jgi:hypothetical protein
MLVINLILLGIKVVTFAFNITMIGRFRAGPTPSVKGVVKGNHWAAVKGNH